ncbi:MAG TPA: FAD-dependent oxidoreductase [Candidatus Micrarchaeia archaeon]|nr:FAD-dependent oxidoreductase [Candidatus Micrarchaeia archaeon]
MPVRDYAKESFWLETAGDSLRPRPRLAGDVSCDVAILGAGFTGLWTAYYLLRQRPGLAVTLVEAEIAGFGASGRNGGWCSAFFPWEAVQLERRFGAVAARALMAELSQAVDEVGRAAAAEGIDCDFRKVGALHIALGPEHRPELEAEGRRVAALPGGVGRVLDRDALAARVRVAGALGAVFHPQCAAIHPGRLVRGLARTVERLGGRIVERTRVEAVEAGRPPRLRTLRGTVRAPTVVVAAEAYGAGLAGLRRRLVPMTSTIVLTEPLPASVWSAIGWSGGECLSSYRHSVDYLQRTADQRILFGGRGAPYHFGSRIPAQMGRDHSTQRMLRLQARRWFPALADARFSHGWAGVVGVPRDFMPSIRHDRAAGVVVAGGYVGDGVSTTNLFGRTVAELILGDPSPRTHLPFVGHRSPNWEPEPLRWLGVRYVQRGLLEVDRRAGRTGRPPSGRTLAERIYRR